MITRHGQYVLPVELLEALPANIRRDMLRVRSVDNDCSPITQHRIAVFIRDHDRGYMIESKFDASHGRRYMALVYCSKEGRKACWDFLVGDQS